MQYAVFDSDTLDNLVEIVNQMIQEGWRPLGGVAVNNAYSGRSTYYIQAMTKE